MIPVCLMSFDRPLYLEMVLQSLLRQNALGRHDLRFILFQDEAVNPFSQRRHANDWDIEACINRFKEYMPDGLVMRAPHNLGVALNFDRAERFVFEDLECDRAIFLEDDLVLQTTYFDALLRLLDAAVHRDHIGMVSAYGAGLTIPIAEQHARRHEVAVMNEHNWGFGITARFWRERDKIVKEYVAMISEVDYRERNQLHAKIFGWMRRFGRDGRGYLSSQDSVKNMAAEVLGYSRITSVVTLGRYIGRNGLHMSADRFRSRGYHQTNLYPYPIDDDFEIPDRVKLERLRATTLERLTRR